MPYFVKFMKSAILILTGWLSVFYADAQPGCTDPQAMNFDPSATQNDGSCAYPPTIYTPQQLANLPAAIAEASGLEFFNGQLWLQQDGGAGPMLHTLDTLTSAVLQTLPLPSLENKDWEDLAENATHLYVGDFGNNAGNRTDLRIYKISKNDLLAGTVTAEIIEFSFSDQTDFTPAPNATNHDCEAFVVLGDSLHIFSKRWLDNTTRRYVLPTTPGTYIADLRDSFDTDCLVTAADVSDEGMLLLLGYDGSTSETSLWLLWDYPGTSVFAGNKRKLTLGSAINMSQAEGIAFSSPTTGFICSERISVFQQRLLRFDVGPWSTGPSATAAQRGRAGLLVYPNPFSDCLNIDFQGVVEDGAALALLAADGCVLQNAVLRSGTTSLDTTILPVGTYFLLVKNGGTVRVEKVVKW